MVGPHTVVIGGGIAGLSVAGSLAERGERVTLLEREAAFGTHSSARNAQIWLPVDDDLSTGPLARRSAARLTRLLGREDRWLTRSGALVLGSDDQTAGIQRGAARAGLTAHIISSAEARELSPLVESDLIAQRVDGAGVFDPHAMISGLGAACRDAGVELRTGAGVAAIELSGGEVRGVTLEGGERIEAGRVVNASGAWAGSLGAAIGAPVPLVPIRRHLVLLDAPPADAGTVVWSFANPSVYFRPESGGVLASPCDERAWEPCLPTADAGALELLGERLATVAPTLVDAPVRTSWACLRTYTHDRELVLGPDPRVPGLVWLAGLGGRGMTVGVGAGELCAAAIGGALTSNEAKLVGSMRADRSQPESMQPL